MPVVAAVSWARAATRWERRSSFCTPDGDRRTPRSARWSTSWRAPRVGRATASAITASTWSGGVAVGITGGRRSLGSSAARPYRWARPAQR